MFLDEGVIEVVTGVNLPMVIKLATYNGQDSLTELAPRICDQGRQGIYLAGALLPLPGKVELIEVVERTLRVTSRLGLHARAAANLVRVASQFKSSLTLERLNAGVRADAKSILSILMLAASRGTDLRVIADGVDEEEGLAAVVSLLPAILKRPEERLRTGPSPL